MNGFIERLKEMFGVKPKVQPNYIGPEVSRSVQRNEQANENARRALEAIKEKGNMRVALEEISGKMK